MRDQFDISGVFETTEFEIAQVACSKIGITGINSFLFLIFGPIRRLWVLTVRPSYAGLGVNIVGFYVDLFQILKMIFIRCRFRLHRCKFLKLQQNIWLSLPVLLRVTDEGALPEIVQYGPSSRFECFTASKGSNIYFYS